MASVYLSKKMPNGEMKAEWVSIDNPVPNSNAQLHMFGIKIPLWGTHPGYHNLHLVDHKTSVAGVAQNIWDAAQAVISGKALLQSMEKHARGEGWYDARQFPNIERHIGKVGAVLGSLALLKQYLAEQRFDKPGYYNGQHVCVLSGPPFDLDNSKEYRR